ncbi:MAG: ABC transporter permease, partial [Pseudolysinimonas sp.]
MTTPIAKMPQATKSPVVVTSSGIPLQKPSFARVTFIVFWRQLRIALRNPAWVIIGLAQPILYLALFGPLLEPLAGSFGVTNAYTIFVPGLLVQLGIFGALFTGFGLVAEWRAGVIEAERVTPASRT